MAGIAQLQILTYPAVRFDPGRKGYLGNFLPIVPCSNPCYGSRRQNGYSI